MTVLADWHSKKRSIAVKTCKNGLRATLNVKDHSLCNALVSASVFFFVCLFVLFYLLAFYVAPTNVHVFCVSLLHLLVLANRR